MFDIKLASGAANPMWNKVAPAIKLIKYETGTLKRKVEARFITIEKSECPEPIKKPLVQNTMGTSIYSTLKLLA